MNPPPNLSRVRWTCLAILMAGLVLRTAVFVYLAPQNNDNHFAVIQAIYQTHQIPHSSQFNQAYHPPLYHLLAAPLLGLGGAKTVQGLSLVFSLATLLVVFLLLRRLGWLDERLKPWCLALPAFHPQFIIYTLLISNDTLAILLGALIFDQAARCLERPTLARQAALALYLGLGLLTKFTFLAFAPAVALFLLLLNARAGLPPRARAARLAGLLLIAAAVGGYKFADNAVRYHNPFISNLDFPYEWIESQRPTWRGPATLLDVNVLKLAANPVISPVTAHSWPLMLYGSFWYSYIPECSFRSNRTPYRAVGSLIDLAALAPTILMLAGLCVWLRGLARGGGGEPDWPAEKRILGGTALLVLAFNLVIVEQAGWKYDVWSVFQGRLFFPSYVPILFLLHEGLRWAGRWRGAALGARIALAGLFLLFFFYLGLEMRMNALSPVDPNRWYFMTGHPVNMKAE